MGASYATCLPRARSLSRLPRGKAGRAQRPASHAGASAFRWMTSARGGKTPGPTATHLPAHEPEPGHKQRPGMCFRNGRYLGEDHEIIVIVVRRAKSEEHTSELQSLMRISYAVFCLKKKILITYT